MCWEFRFLIPLVRSCCGVTDQGPHPLWFVRRSINVSSVPCPSLLLLPLSPLLFPIFTPKNYGFPPHRAARHDKGGNPIFFPPFLHNFSWGRKRNKFWREKQERGALGTFLCKGCWEIGWERPTPGMIVCLAPEPKRSFCCTQEFWNCPKLVGVEKGTKRELLENRSALTQNVLLQWWNLCFMSQPPRVWGFLQVNCVFYKIKKRKISTVCVGIGNLNLDP